MSTNVANVISHFPDVENGFTTTTAGSVASGATTVTLNSVAGYTNGEPIVLVIEPTSATAKQTFTGIVDTAGVQVTSVVWTAGTNQTHALGVTVVDYATATHIAMISKGIKAHANQDGSLITSAVQTALAAATSTQEAGSTMMAIRNETQFDFIASGGVWSGDSYASTRNASMTALTCYINGQRGTISAVTARSFTASKDTYVDVLNTAGVFTLVYTEVANNAASPALAANSIRIGIIVTGASNIAAAGSVNQGQESMVIPIASSVAYSVVDSLGNIICPRDPFRKVLGYKQIVANVAGTTTASQVPGLSVPIIVPAGRKISVTTGAQYVAVATAPGDAQLNLWDGAVGGTKLNLVQTYCNTANFGYTLSIGGTFTLSAGSHTINLGYNGVAGNITMGAAASQPAWIKVELA